MLQGGFMARKGLHPLPLLMPALWGRSLCRNRGAAVGFAGNKVSAVGTHSCQCCAIKAAALGSSGAPLGCVPRCGALTGRRWGPHCTSLALTRGHRCQVWGRGCQAEFAAVPRAGGAGMSPSRGPAVHQLSVTSRGSEGSPGLKNRGDSVWSPHMRLVFKAVAVLISATRCAQLSRVGSQPGSEVRGWGLGEEVIWFPAWALTHPCILPCPPRDLLLQTKRGSAAHAVSPALLPPPLCCLTRDISFLFFFSPASDKSIMRRGFPICCWGHGEESPALGAQRQHRSLLVLVVTQQGLGAAALCAIK